MYYPFVGKVYSFSQRKKNQSRAADMFTKQDAFLRDHSEKRGICACLGPIPFSK